MVRCRQPDDMRGFCARRPDAVVETRQSVGAGVCFLLALWRDPRLGNVSRTPRRTPRRAAGRAVRNARPHAVGDVHRSDEHLGGDAARAEQSKSRARHLDRRDHDQPERDGGNLASGRRLEAPEQDYNLQGANAYLG